MTDLVAASDKRQAMLAALQRTVSLCNCAWPLTRYRNGDGHHPDCPAHAALLGGVPTGSGAGAHDPATDDETPEAP